VNATCVTEKEWWLSVTHDFCSCNFECFWQGSLGKVTIQIDRVVMEGTVSGQYTLQPDTNRDGSARSLEVEFQWSNR
jgi:hypothetical protein